MARALVNIIITVYSGLHRSKDSRLLQRARGCCPSGYCMCVAGVHVEFQSRSDQGLYLSVYLQRFESGLTSVGRFRYVVGVGRAICPTEDTVIHSSPIGCVTVECTSDTLKSLFWHVFSPRLKYVKNKIKKRLKYLSTQKVQKNAIYSDKTQHANFRVNPFIKLQNGTYTAVKR